jgi:predicted GNAT family acetyltransferase
MTETLSFNAAQSRYEMAVGDATVIANVTRDGDVLRIKYVEAPPALRGTGAAGRFMKLLMETARAENLKVIPVCGYAATWIDRNGEYTDMLAP